MAEIKNEKNYSNELLAELQKKEAELINQSKLQTILMNIASEYINIELSEIEVTLNKSLGELAQFVNADRAYIFDYNWENDTCSNTYEWCREGTNPEIDNLQDVPLEILPQWVATHKKGETMYIDDVFSLPEYDGVRQILEPQGVKSLITLPIMDKMDCKGFVGFDSVANFHIYSEKERSLLLLFAQMLVNINNRKEAETSIQEYAKELEETNKELDIAFKKAEASNRAKSEFLANMSHEIRTPMNSILGFSEVMLNTTNDNVQKSYLKTILESGKTLLSIINDILDLSKIEAGRMEVSPEPTDLRIIINEIKQLFEQKVREKEVGFDVEIEDNFPRTIVIDEIRIRQILLNIVGNAVKFTQKGFVKIKVYLLNDKNGIINFRIEVIDSGIGISEEYRARVFESFSQQSGLDSRKFGGTGLGLSISKRLCELMGGEISFDSKMGIGTTFSLSFYNIKYSDESIETDESYLWDEDSISFKGSKILIVDDVAYNRNLVITYLSDYNLELFEAENGEMAIQMMSLNKPDFVFMDIRMPGMSGYETSETIKSIKEYSFIPIVALTASTMKSELDRINRIFDGFLRKPVQKKTIVKELTKHLPFEIIEVKPEKQIKTAELEKDIIISEQVKSRFWVLFTDDMNNTDTMFIDELNELLKKIILFAEVNNIPQLKRKTAEINNNIEAFEFDKVLIGLKIVKKMFE